MNQVSRMRIFNTVGISATIIFGYALYKRLINPMSRYYEHNMIVEAQDLNTNLVGKEIEEGLIFRKTEVDGENVIFNVEATNKFVKNSDEANNVLYTKLCILILNSGDVYLKLTNFIWKIHIPEKSSLSQISMNRDSCIKSGYRPVTG